jgi:uncharacterized NAD(P)/FAD-binding protein YdhS
MNVRAGRLSLVDEDAGHFVNWLQANSDSTVSADSFAPRSLYGRYASKVLAAAQAKGHPYAALKHIHGEVVDLYHTEAGVELRLDNGTSIRADAAVLAPGNSPPSQDAVPDAAFRSSAHYLRGVWHVATVSLEPHASVLLVGSGLTAIDVVVALNECGFKGVIHLVSRRGLWPRVHAPHPPPLRTIWEGETFGSLRVLLRALRREVQWAEANGGNWRAVVDSLRPYANRLWQELSPADHRRFFRHVRPYWEAHRHRMAPQVAQVIEALVQQGRLRLHAGRVQAAFGDGEAAEVHIKLRDGCSHLLLHVSRVINCTAPESDYRKLPHPLCRNLLARGVGVPGPLGLGLRTGPDGELINTEGLPSQNLFTLGPTRFGTLFETTSVEEIRVQAAALASRLLGATSQSHRNTGVVARNVQYDARLPETTPRAAC